MIFKDLSKPKIDEMFNFVIIVVSIFVLIIIIGASIELNNLM
jgi:hypothetical protein